MVRRFCSGLLAGALVFLCLILAGAPASATAVSNGSSNAGGSVTLPPPYTTTTSSYATHDSACNTSGGTTYTLDGMTIYETCTYTQTTTTWTTTTTHTPDPIYTVEQTGTTTITKMVCCQAPLLGYKNKQTGTTYGITGYTTVTPTFYKTMYHWVTYPAKTRVPRHCILGAATARGGLDCYLWVKAHWTATTDRVYEPYVVSWSGTPYSQAQYGQVPVYTQEPVYGPPAPYLVAFLVPVYGNVLTGYTWTTSSSTTVSTSSRTLTGAITIGCTTDCGYGYRGSEFVIPTPY